MLVVIEICGYVPEKDQILPNVQLHDLLKGSDELGIQF
jgi:hypothetical protein